MNGYNQQPIALSVVIAAFNEEESLERLQQELHAVLERVGEPYEIIYVNDGSTDGTAALLGRLEDTYPRVAAVSYNDNRGQAAAFHEGFKHVRGAWIITLDADLQLPAGEIPNLLAFRDEYDFIIGVRKEKKEYPSQVIASALGRFFSRTLLGDTTEDPGCMLRVFKREVVRYFPAFYHAHLFFPYCARYNGFKVKEIPVRHIPRQFGATKYRLSIKIWGGILGFHRIILYRMKRC